MRKALCIWSPLTRNSSEMRMTPSSHAYSISRSLAMMKKFWSSVARRKPMMMANVRVVVAMMIHGRFFLKPSL